MIKTRKIKLLGERLKNERRSQSMTQTDLGKLIGIGKAYMSMLESGKRRPGSHKLMQLCKALGVSADWLLGLSEVKRIRRKVTR